MQMCDGGAQLARCRYGNVVCQAQWVDGGWECRCKVQVQLWVAEVQAGARTRGHRPSLAWLSTRQQGWRCWAQLDSGTRGVREGCPRKRTDSRINSSTRLS